MVFVSVNTDMLSLVRPLLVTCFAAVLVWSISSRAVADTVIGDWESGTREGWFDWNTGTPTTTVEPPIYAFNSIGATLGEGAIQYNSPGSYTQWLAIKLQLDANDPLANGIANYRPDFLANTKLAFDLTFVASEQTAGNDFANLGLFVNSNTWGFNRIGDPNNDFVPESVTAFSGFNGGKSWNPSLLVGTQTSTWTYDIGFLHDGNTDNGEIVEGDYIEIIFEEYSNNTTVIHLDNFRFFTPATPVEGDYNGDGNVNAADYTVFRNHLGETFQIQNEVAGVTPGMVTPEDYDAWKTRYEGGTGSGGLVGSAAPEPNVLALAALALAGIGGLLRRR
jgi:hypothetical protein